VRVAIYARVSTDDKGQDPETQLSELRAWCASAGHTISQQYVDYESGRKGADKRKQFAALFVRDLVHRAARQSRRSPKGKTGATEN
jgi:DNA invertase Pin-like site-specific DNA recombinase